MQHLVHSCRCDVIIYQQQQCEPRTLRIGKILTGKMMTQMTIAKRWGAMGFQFGGSHQAVLERLPS